jgi:hypothetical protein
MNGSTDRSATWSISHSHSRSAIETQHQHS